MRNLLCNESVILLHHRPFRFYFLANGLSELSYQIAGVAVGWQVYALTHSPFALGMVGLVQFIPSVLLVFIIGHVADRYDRKRVAQLCQAAQSVAAAFLAYASITRSLSVPVLFISIAVLSAATAFESPTLAALIPAVTPEGQLQRGTALSMTVSQLASISGPAIGGLLYVYSSGAAYLTMAVLSLAASFFCGAIAVDRPIAVKDQPTVESVFGGVRFVRRDRVILGAVSLDLFAVLFGGATALLPIYARDILHSGPWGLGILRAAPAVGALLMTIVLARHPLMRRVGLRMFQAVIVFGCATVLFAISRWMALSLAALAAIGAADMVSVIIRSSLVQLRTPDPMRGRVGALNFLFINASNQLGGFESGLTAALIGAVPSVALGGIGTILIACIWMRLFPVLREAERLEADRQPQSLASGECV